MQIHAVAVVGALGLTAALSTAAGAQTTDGAIVSRDAATTPAFAFPPAGEARILNASGIDRLLTAHGKRLLVVNFWATWCAPCVAEIPHFIEVSNDYRKRDVLFVGLSADFVDEWETTVPPFLKEKKVPYPNFVLDVDPNVMVPKFSKEWSGSLPATFYFDKTGRALGHRIGAVEKKVLEADIEKYLKAGEAKKSK